MNADPMIPGKTYLFKHTTQTVTGQIESLRYRVDVNTLRSSPAPDLQLNEIGRCSITLSQPIFFDAYARNRSTGSFIIIDRITNATVGAGMISDRDSAKSTTAAWETNDRDANEAALGISSVTAEERVARFGQLPATVLFAGLTGSGKTTIANAVERKLFDSGRAVVVIDGEMMRRGVNRDLGFTVEERSENLRRSAHIAKIINDNGLICLAAFNAPSQIVRDRVADLIGRDRFFTVYCTADEKTRRQRDEKGHYAKAEAGELPNFPGVTAIYEEPENPDLVLDTSSKSIAECVDEVIKMLQAKKIVK
jgi:bifunctional enzyme CysN/CysC